MKSALTTVWIAALGFGLWYSASEVRALSHQRFSILDTPPGASLDSKMINVITLGHKGLWDDFVSVWTLQFLFDNRLEKESPVEVFRTVDKIARHQPKIESFYMTSCFQMTYLFKRPQDCRSIIVHGMGAFPMSWRLPQILATIYAYEMEDWREAAAFYSIAASRPDAPAFLARLVKTLVEKRQIPQQQLENSIRLFMNHSDPRGGSKLHFFLNQLERRRLQRVGATEEDPS